VAARRGGDYPADQGRGGVVKKKGGGRSPLGEKGAGGTVMKERALVLQIAKKKKKEGGRGDGKKWGRKKGRTAVAKKGTIVGR